MSALGNYKILFISINPFGYIPVFRYIIKFLYPDFNILLVSNFVKGNYSFKDIASEKRIHTYSSSPALSAPSKWHQLKRYFIINMYVLIFILTSKKGYIIYTIDYQVMAIILWWKKVLLSKKTKTIYHQIEAAEPDLCYGMNKRLFTYFQRHAKSIDLTIVPEVNRLKFLCSITDIDKSKTLLIPNSCTNNAVDFPIRHHIISQIPENAFIVGHIGNMGINYSYEYLEAVEQLAAGLNHFIFVGRQCQEISEKLHIMSASNSNIIVCSEIPHYELSQIYPFLNLGIILYKGIDVNHEFCAPNKLYEYWSYGIPVIAHKLKGLKDVFKSKEQGALINMENPEEIYSILNNYIQNNKQDRESLIRLFNNEYAIENYLPILKLRIENSYNNESFTYHHWHSP